MPQKKNPDVPELVRGKTGRVVGHLVALLTLMKGQPLAYNKDNQEDKEPLFDTVDTLDDTLAIFAELVPRHRGQRGGDARAPRAQGFATATDLADYLVQQGRAVPRRARSGRARGARTPSSAGVDLADLPLPVLRRFAPRSATTSTRCSTLEGSVASPQPPRRHGAGAGSRRRPAGACGTFTLAGRRPLELRRPGR